MIDAAIEYDCSFGFWSMAMGKINTIHIHCQNEYLEVKLNYIANAA